MFDGRARRVSGRSRVTVFDRNELLFVAPPTDVSSYRSHSHASSVATGVAVVVIVAAVYWRTAYPTINWWDSASYSLASRTLGLTSSPGSLLLTLIGWVGTRVTSSLTTARVLSLTGAAIAVAAIWLVYAGSLRLRRLA